MAAGQLTGHRIAVFKLSLTGKREPIQTLQFLQSRRDQLLAKFFFACIRHQHGTNGSVFGNIAASTERLVTDQPEDGELGKQEKKSAFISWLPD
jgi:hypothetical protein